MIFVELISISYFIFFFALFHAYFNFSQHWEVLAEPIQTVMRKYGMENPYELLKDMTRGKSVVTKDDLHGLIKKLKLPADQKKKLLDLTPSNYIGNAAEMAITKKYLN